jgi:hypothetical protein
MYQHTNFHNPNTESPCPFLQNCRRGEPVRKGQRSPLSRCARSAVARSRPGTHVSAFKPPCTRDEMHTVKLWSFEKTSIDSPYDDIAILRGGAEMKCRVMFDA